MKEIPLTQGRVALVDDADYEWLSQWRWYSARHFTKRRVRWLAVREQSGRTLYMHRVIMGVVSGDPAVDHRDLDELNNTRANLRLATPQGNAANRAGWATTGYKGVRMESRWRTRRWQAHIRVSGKLLSIGMFATPEAAARAYDAAAREHFGEFAYLNFPEGAAVA